MSHLGAIVMMTTIWIPAIASLALLPYFSRKSVLFGIAIMEEHYDEPDVRALRRKYMYWNIALGVLWWIINIVTMQKLGPDSSARWMAWTVILYLLLSIASFVYCHHAAKRMKAERGWDNPHNQLIAVDTSFHQRSMTFSNWWYLIHLAVVAACAAIAAIYYDRFPDPMITHYDINGQPDATEPKTFWSVFTPNIVQLSMLIIFWLINVMIRKSKQQISFHAPERSREQNIRFRRIWSLFMMVTGLLMILLIAFIQFNPLIGFTEESLSLSLGILPAIVVIGTLVLSFVTGQGGSKLRIGEGTAVVTDQWQVDHDKYWKLGLIYYNRNDPSLFVEKRVGIGWTVNIGHPLGMALLFLPIIIAVVVIVITET
ncbi:DUF1648 domain-containing protein [Paenibacillus sp. GCM10027626]|uniref:DUF1648 domain-containing protein n=1 Tax=Paenibacillus sp. GCM10027626 TaxID=3273411 RepID=UPI0036341A32